MERQCAFCGKRVPVGERAVFQRHSLARSRKRCVGSGVSPQETRSRELVRLMQCLSIASTRTEGELVIQPEEFLFLLDHSPTELVIGGYPIP